MKKFIEIKDLNAGDSLILAWRDDDGQYYPYNVIVKKGGPKIKLIDPDIKSLSTSFTDFYHIKKGIDINGNKLIELLVFDTVKEAKDWCNTENKFNKDNDLI